MKAGSDWPSKDYFTHRTWKVNGMALKLTTAHRTQHRRPARPNYLTIEFEGNSFGTWRVSGT